MTDKKVVFYNKNMITEFEQAFPLEAKCSIPAYGPAGGK